MNEYLLGVVTIPAALIAGYLLMAATAWTVAALGRLHLGIIRRIRPDQPTVAQRRAAIMFGLRRGAIFSRGEFVLIVGYGLDEDRRNWARQRLLRDLIPATPDPAPREVGHARREGER